MCIQQQPRVAVETRGDGRKSLLVARWRLPQAAADIALAAAAAAAAVAAGAAAVAAVAAV